MASKKSDQKIDILSGTEELLHNINIGNMILKAFKSKPDFLGQINAVTEEQTTYQQMWENSIKCALWLKQFRGKKNIIAICTCHKMLEYIPFLASIYVGATVNPWDEKYMKNSVRTMYFLIEYKPDIIFIDSDNYGHLESTIRLMRCRRKHMNPVKIITFGRIEGVDSLESILNNDFEKTKIDEFSCVDMIPMDIIAIMFSPRTTSYFNSKIFIPYYVLTYPSNQEVPVMSSGDIGLWYASLNWSYGVILTVRSIISYVTVVKCSKFSDKNMYETIQKYKVSWVFLESKMCTQMFHTDIRMYDVSSIKQLIIDDSSINVIDAQQNLSDKFINASIVQVYSIEGACMIAAFQRNNQRLGSSGYVAKNIQLKLLNICSKKFEPQEIVGPCRIGAIWYKFICKWCSPQTCKLQNCSNYRAKKDTFIDKSAMIFFSNIWRCTGDYGYYEKDGEIFLIDKVKDLIKYRNHFLSPTKIENMLLQHPAVSEVAVKSVPNATDGHHPVAYVKKKCGAEVTESELMKFVADNLPDIYNLRGGLYFKSHMPHLPNGKVDRMLCSFRT